MWEIIRKNKIKSVVAFIVILIWNWIVLWLFWFFIIFFFNVNIMQSLYFSFGIGFIQSLLLLFMALHKHEDYFYIWNDYFNYTERHNLGFWNNSVIVDFTEKVFLG